MSKAHSFVRAAATTAAMLLAMALPAAAELPASQIPDLVQPPNGINLGNTSFYDGFSTLNPGVTVLGYLRANLFNSITDSHGRKSSSYDHTRVNVTTQVTQFSVVTPFTIDGNALGFDLLVPITNIDASFGSGGRQLSANHAAFGDLTFGPFIQFKPIISDSHPIASFRAAVDVIAPTGGFDRNRDMNQSSGYWSLNPFVAWTVLPVPGWEVSGRLQYLYNFSTTNIANPPSIPSFTFKNGQAGQLVYSNFAISREVDPGISVGLNGFYLQQINNDQINGISLPNTRRSAVYMGPGLHIDRLPGWGLNLNVYLPVSTRNTTTGPQFNLQFILPL